MRIQFQLFIGMFCCFLLLTSTVNAHPGRTDSNGGHTCRTNCANWGLEPGEYHYHNGGSNSGGGNSSNTDSPSKKNTEKSPPSTPKPTPKPAPPPVPKVDKQQVQADEHYKTANDLYDNAKYEATITELEGIYDLEKNDNKTDALVQKSITAIYELAETAFSEEDYQTAKDHLAYIQDYNRSSGEIKQKAITLHKQIEVIEEVKEILAMATISRDEKEYEETIRLILQAQKITDSDEITTFYNESIEALANDAETAYKEKQYDEAISYYNILLNSADTSKVKDQYQATLQQIQSEQLIQDIFEINTADLVGESLFNHLLEEDNETASNDNIVNSLKSSLATEAKKDIRFIYDMSMNELFNGGENDAD